MIALRFIITTILALAPVVCMRYCELRVERHTLMHHHDISHVNHTETNKERTTLLEHFDNLMRSVTESISTPFIFIVALIAVFLRRAPLDRLHQTFLDAPIPPPRFA
jgi:hypothetical protein